MHKMSIAMMRQSAGYTQTALGELLGVTQQQVARYESGTTKPSPAVFKRLMEVFGLTLEEAWEMFYEDGEEKEGEE